MPKAVDYYSEKYPAVMEYVLDQLAGFERVVDESSVEFEFTFVESRENEPGGGYHKLAVCTQGLFIFVRPKRFSLFDIPLEITERQQIALEEFLIEAGGDFEWWVGPLSRTSLSKHNGWAVFAKDDDWVIARRCITSPEDRDA